MQKILLPSTYLRVLTATREQDFCSSDVRRARYTQPKWPVRISQSSNQSQFGVIIHVSKI